MEYKITSIDCVPEIDPYHADIDQLARTVIEIDPIKKEVCVFQDYQTNSTSFDVWNGLVAQGKISTYPENELVRNFLESKEGQEYISQICDGFEIYYYNGNKCGSWNENYSSIMDELIEELEMFKEYEYLYLDDYYDYRRENITANTSDEEIEEMVEEIRVDGYIILGNLNDYLKDWRDELKENEEE